MYMQQFSLQYVPYISGEYYVNQKNRWGLYRPSLVFCDMETRRCGVQGGWMYVTSLDMKRPDDNCPSQFKTEVPEGMDYDDDYFLENHVQ